MSARLASTFASGDLRFHVEAFLVIETSFYPLAGSLSRFSLRGRDGVRDSRARLEAVYCERQSAWHESLCIAEERRGT